MSSLVLALPSLTAALLPSDTATREAAACVSLLGLRLFHQSRASVDPAAAPGVPARCQQEVALSARALEIRAAGTALFGPPPDLAAAAPTHMVVLHARQQLDPSAADGRADAAPSVSERVQCQVLCYRMGLFAHLDRLDGVARWAADAALALEDRPAGAGRAPTPPAPPLAAAGSAAECPPQAAEVHCARDMTLRLDAVQHEIALPSDPGAAPCVLIVGGSTLAELLINDVWARDVRTAASRRTGMAVTQVKLQLLGSELALARAWPAAPAARAQLVSVERVGVSAQSCAEWNGRGPTGVQVGEAGEGAAPRSEASVRIALAPVHAELSTADVDGVRAVLAFATAQAGRLAELAPAAAPDASPGGPAADYATDAASGGDELPRYLDLADGAADGSADEVKAEDVVAQLALRPPASELSSPSPASGSSSPHTNSAPSPALSDARTRAATPAGGSRTPAAPSPAIRPAASPTSTSATRPPSLAVVHLDASCEELRALLVRSGGGGSRYTPLLELRVRHLEARGVQCAGAPQLGGVPVGGDAAADGAGAGASGRAQSTHTAPAPARALTMHCELQGSFYNTRALAWEHVIDPCAVQLALREAETSEQLDWLRNACRQHDPEALPEQAPAELDAAAAGAARRHVRTLLSLTAASPVRFTASHALALALADIRAAFRSTPEARVADRRLGHSVATVDDDTAGPCATIENHTGHEMVLAIAAASHRAPSRHVLAAGARCRVSIWTDAQREAAQGDAAIHRGQDLALSGAAVAAAADRSRRAVRRVGALITPSFATATIAGGAEVPDLPISSVATTRRGLRLRGDGTEPDGRSELEDFAAFDELGKRCAGTRSPADSADGSRAGAAIPALRAGGRVSAAQVAPLLPPSAFAGRPTLVWRTEEAPEGRRIYAESTATIENTTGIDLEVRTMPGEAKRGASPLPRACRSWQLGYDLGAVAMGHAASSHMARVAASLRARTYSAAVRHGPSRSTSRRAAPSPFGRCRALRAPAPAPPWQASPPPPSPTLRWSAT